MEECYNNLKAKSPSLLLIPIKRLADVDSVDYRFDAPTEPPPREVNDEVRRKEEADLQRALELSVQDKGGRPEWSQYTLASNEAPGSKPGQSSSQAYQAPPPESGYVPTSAVPPQVHVLTAFPTAQHPPARDAVSPVNPSPSALVTRVRALHSFEPTEVGELAFERGDIIRVVDRGYKDWWRGQLRGRTGIFPVNYVVSRRVGCLDLMSRVLTIRLGISAGTDSS
jgi:signal transducing adaptor molecule